MPARAGTRSVLFCLAGSGCTPSIAATVPVGDYPGASLDEVAHPPRRRAADISPVAAAELAIEDPLAQLVTALARGRCPELSGRPRSGRAAVAQREVRLLAQVCRLIRPRKVIVSPGRKRNTEAVRGGTQVWPSSVAQYVKVPP